MVESKAPCDLFCGNLVLEATHRQERLARADHPLTDGISLRSRCIGWPSCVLTQSCPGTRVNILQAGENARISLSLMRTCRAGLLFTTRSVPTPLGNCFPTYRFLAEGFFVLCVLHFLRQEDPRAKRPLALCMARYMLV